MSGAAAKKPRETLTLRDSIDLLLDLNRWIEDHIDEIEMNGGALPDDLAALLDEIDASRAAKVDAIACKLDEFNGYAIAAKATKDRAARRQKVWENSITSLRAYAQREVERSGAGRLQGLVAVLRLQTNSAPAVECRLDNDQLLIEHAHYFLYRESGGRRVGEFVTVQQVATIDKKALGAAFMARRAELEAEAGTIADADLVGVLDITSIVNGEPAPTEPVDPRTAYVARTLAAEFPGVSVTRGHHLRID